MPIIIAARSYKKYRKVLFFKMYNLDIFRLFCQIVYLFSYFQPFESKKNITFAHAKFYSKTQSIALFIV